MVTKTVLNNKLKAVLNNTNESGLKTLVEETTKKFRSLFEAKTTTVGSKEQGFQVVGDEAGRITDDSKLAPLELKKISTQKSNISTLTGLTAQDGFLESCVSSINPKGIKTTLETLAPNKKPQVEPIYKASSLFTDVVVEAAEDDESPEGFAKDFVKEFKRARSVSLDLTSFVESEERTSITNSVTGDTNISSVITKDLTLNSSAQLTEPIIVNTTGSFNGVSTPINYEFTYINTVEELMLEFRNSERPFSQIIVEYTGEYLDDNFSARDFQTLYSTTKFTQNGFDGIPYHYLIRKDGSIQRGRPLDIETVFPSDISYANAVVVAIPGGYNVPYGTERAKATVNSGTTGSWKSFNALLDVAYTMFPGIQVYSSDALKEIGWDANVYIETVFGKQNNISQTGTITRTNLISVGV